MVLEASNPDFHPEYPYFVKLDYQSMFDEDLAMTMANWCDHQYAQNTWCFVIRGFLFKHSEDAVFFVLRWQ